MFYRQWFGVLTKLAEILSNLLGGRLLTDSTNENLLCLALPASRTKMLMLHFTFTAAGPKMLMFHGFILLLVLWSRRLGVDGLSIQEVRRDRQHLFVFHLIFNFQA